MARTGEATGVPRLADDAARTWRASYWLVGLSFPVSVAYGVVAARRDVPLDLVFWVGSLLAIYTAYFVIYLVLTWRVFGRAEPEQLVRWVRETNVRTTEQRRRHFWAGAGTRTGAVTAAVLALLGVLAVAFTPSLRTPLMMLASFGLVTSAWASVVVVHAVAYLRDDVDGGGLRFPDESALRWTDYVYVAVQVSTTFSTSDVTVTSGRTRSLVTAHTLVAFIFNTVVVALLVSAILVAV